MMRPASGTYRAWTAARRFKDDMIFGSLQPRWGCSHWPGVERSDTPGRSSRRASPTPAGVAAPAVERFGTVFNAQSTMRHVKPSCDPRGVEQLNLSTRIPVVEHALDHRLMAGTPAGSPSKRSVVNRSYQPCAQRVPTRLDSAASDQKERLTVGPACRAGPFARQSVAPRPGPTRQVGPTTHPATPHSRRSPLTPGASPANSIAVDRQEMDRDPRKRFGGEGSNSPLAPVLRGRGVGGEGQQRRRSPTASPANP